MFNFFFKKGISAVFVGLCISLLSCKTDPESTDDRTVFRYNESANITSLDPAFARNQANIWGVNQIFNSLLQLNDQLEIKPSIAKKWHIDEDGLTYTFYLRDDVYFHDHYLFEGGKGRRVKASDFVYSLSRIVDDKIASPGSWVFNSVAHTEDGGFAFSAPDDTTFVVRLSRSFPPFLGILTMQYASVVPREIVEYYGRDFRRNPIGTGPFRFKYWREGVKLVLLKNDHYFEFDSQGQRLPYLDAVSITFIIDKQAAFLEFIKGNIDFLSGIDASYKDELLTRSGDLNPKYAHSIRLKKAPYLNTEYLGFLVNDSLPLSVESPIFDKRIRQAINYGFDRSRMMLFLRNNVGIPATSGFIPSGMPAFDSDIVKGYDYNPDKARRLLAEAGFPNGKGLPPITLSTNASYLDLAQYIQSALDEIGIQIRIDVLPPGTLRELIARSDLNFFRGSWIADYPDAENYLSLFYSPNFTPAGPNYTHFKSDKFDALYEKSLGIVDDSIRYELYREMDNLIMQKAPVVVLYYDEVLRFSQKNISGLGINPLNLLTLKHVQKK